MTICALFVNLYTHTGPGKRKKLSSSEEESDGLEEVRALLYAFTKMYGKSKF
jgi:hypothetical protein